MARKLLESMIIGASATATMTVVDKKRLTFTAKVGTDDVADQAGRIKKFKDVDTFVASLLSSFPSTDSLTVEINTDGVREVRIPGDPVAAATAKKARLVDQKARVQTLLNDAITRLARIVSYNNSGVPSYQAAYNEAVAQKTSMEGTVAFYDEQIAIQNAIITPPAPAPAGN